MESITDYPYAYDHYKRWEFQYQTCCYRKSIDWYEKADTDNYEQKTDKSKNFIGSWHRRTVKKIVFITRKPSEYVSSFEVLPDGLSLYSTGTSAILKLLSSAKIVISVSISNPFDIMANDFTKSRLKALAPVIMSLM